MKTILIILAVALVSVQCVVSYSLGKDAGYKQGWSDAQCGKGQECEGGQD